MTSFGAKPSVLTMANDTAYKSSVSGIRILRYRVRAPKDGEDENAIPCIYLLVWNGTCCGTKSFSSFFEAWSAVQAIDRQHLSALLKWEPGSKDVEVPDYPKSELLEKVLLSHGISDDLKDDYDFQAILDGIRTEIGLAMTSRVDSASADAEAGLEEESTVRKKFGL